MRDDAERCNKACQAGKPDVLPGGVESSSAADLPQMPFLDVGLFSGSFGPRRFPPTRISTSLRVPTMFWPLRPALTCLLAGL